MPAFAVDYNPGVAVGQYVKYGNFAGTGQGFEAFNDYSFLQLQVTNVSGKEVTLLSTGQFKNGTALPGNSTTTVWNIETGTEDGTPNTQGPIIAANLNQGDAIPPPGTYKVNATEDRTFLGVSRTVNILSITISTSDYNSTLSYVYDKSTGMLLESSTQTITIRATTCDFQLFVQRYSDQFVRQYDGKFSIVLHHFAYRYHSCNSGNHFAAKVEKTLASGNQRSVVN